MKWVLAVVLVTVTLAGCSKQSSHPLDPYVMDELDVPDACYYIDIEEDDEAAQIAAFIGVDSNPGSLNNSYLMVSDITPEDNRYAFFECKFSSGVYQFASGAMLFETEQDAAVYIEEAVDQTGFVSCVGQAEVFIDGDVIGAVVSLSEDEAWHPAFAAKKDAFLDGRYEKGAVDQCRAMQS